ncbi:MAG: winged helix-turn-helix domain-containing protein [Actinomycetota bacterium]
MEEPIILGPLEIAPAEYRAKYDDRELQLTRKEFDLLTLFARNPRRVLRRPQIAQLVWGGEVHGRTIDIHVSRLRRRLPQGAIETVTGVGYRIAIL